MSDAVLKYMQQIDNAESSEELCSILYNMHGFELMPGLVFHSNGLLRSFTSLKETALKSLSTIFKTQRDEQVALQYLDVLHKNNTRAPISYHTTSIQDRAHYMKTKQFQASLYVDEAGYPR